MVPFQIAGNNCRNYLDNSSKHVFLTLDYGGGPFPHTKRVRSCVSVHGVCMCMCVCVCVCVIVRRPGLPPWASMHFRGTVWQAQSLDVIHHVLLLKRCSDLYEVMRHKNATGIVFYFSHRTVTSCLPGQ